MTRSVRVALAAACVAACAVRASAAPAPKKPAAHARPIAIVVNGEELARDPAPRVSGYRVLVPVVRIYSALGISVARDGATLVASAPSKRIAVTVGSRPRLGRQSHRADGSAGDGDRRRDVRPAAVRRRLARRAGLVEQGRAARRGRLVDRRAHAGPRAAHAGRIDATRRHRQRGRPQLGARVDHADVGAVGAHDRDHVGRAHRRAGRRHAHEHARVAQRHPRRRRRRA